MNREELEKPMDFDGKNTEFGEDSEFKKKAAETFKVCVAAAKKFGGIVWDFGRKLYSAIRDKARELGEKIRESRRKAREEEEKTRRMYEEQVQKIERRRAEVRQTAEGPSAVQHVVTGSADKWRGDPEDKCFAMSYGWLYLMWWLGNIIDSVLCLWWFGSAMDSYHSRDTAWIALVVWVLALLFNRLAYEGGVALFEMVRHLRQIRDELRRHNMREEELHKDDHTEKATP